MQAYNLKMVVDKLIFPEGLRWHDGALWLSDMWDYKVLRVTGENKCETVVEVPNRPSGLGFLSDGTAIAVSMTDRCLYKIKDGAL